ncbi:hypothetical protein [Actinoplanes sp. DH11]|uniref:hypothetical protein n=1 Tax=Actinoplanes sp. DH11 TaxID=2857011 RepID=UPI001E5AE415|nr:hypothetical protein [Actinoplanes sp. DH11]
MNYRPIHLILDTSAVIEYTRGSDHVGELLVEVDAEDAAVGVPFLCLSEALPYVTDRDRLQLLVTHPAVRIVSDEPWSWQAHAALRDLVGSSDAASAASAAINDEVWVLTRRPGLYAGINDGDLAIPIPD